MSGSGDRLPRLLALLPYLLAHPGVRVGEVAADFDVPEAQLRRDLQLLWMCGLPGHGPGDLIDLSFEGDTVTVGHDAGLARPLRLTADEALALVVALRTLADEPALTDRGAVERALAKVEAAAGGAVEAASAVAVAVEPTDRVLAQLRGALDLGRAVHLTYYVAARDESTERDVDPVRLRWADGRWYLEAWCRSVRAMRFFRIDRVDGVRILDEPSDPPADAVPRDLSEGVYQPAPEHPLVTLRLDQPGRWVADYYPCETVAPLPDGRLEVTLRAADTSWLRRLVLGLGGAAEVVGPQWLAEQVRAEAVEALSAYP
ncbi:MAG TPA: WYL domain-containing protein [Mycobacteriales bacterium]|nr:WYL domain-containing protein [Mycobacteriales bacterium]